MKPIYFISCLFLLFNCSENNSNNYNSAKKENVETLFVNANIWGSPSEDDKVIAINNDRIIYVGKENNFSSENIIDLGGKFIMPGFIDAHTHFIDGGQYISSIDLKEATSKEEFIAKIKDYIAKIGKGKWVLTGNWDHSLWGGELPHKDWINEISKDNPIFITRLDAHMALANDLALKMANIDKNTPDPEGGIIMKDENGELTGILKDIAMNKVIEIIPKNSFAENLQYLQAAQEYALSLGLTKIHTVAANDTEEWVLDFFRKAKEQGVLKIRATISIPIDDIEYLVEDINTNGYGDEMLNWASVKGFIDGSLGSGTAWFYDEYIDEKGNFGIVLSDLDILQKNMEMAFENNIGVNIHAIGDKANDKAIELMQKTAFDNLAEQRYHIEHFQHPSMAAIEKLAENAIIASMQPSHLVDDGRWARNKIGDRVKTSYAFRSIIDDGGVLAFGSDWPVASLSPLDGVFAAVTRETIDNKNPNGWIESEKISVDEALRSYTINNAFAFNEEDDYGTIEVGKKADLIVLSHDPREVNPKEIKNINVLLTMVNGEILFTNEK